MEFGCTVRASYVVTIPVLELYRLSIEFWAKVAWVLNFAGVAVRCVFCVRAHT